MARSKGLGVAVDRNETEGPSVADQPTVIPTVPAATRRPRLQNAVKPAAVEAGASRYAGQFHIGASYDENDEIVEAFRKLAFEKRRKHKDMLYEAMQLLVQKYDAYRSR